MLIQEVLCYKKHRNCQSLKLNKTEVLKTSPSFFRRKFTDFNSLRQQNTTQNISPYFLRSERTESQWSDFYGGRCTVSSPEALTICSPKDCGISRKGSSVKCVDAFRIALTEEPKLFSKQKIAKTVNCLSCYPPPIQKAFSF